MRYWTIDGTLCHKAYKLAMKYHKGQNDKAGMPYEMHLIAVASKCMTHDEQTVALLHDILEDTPCTEEILLSSGISAHIVEAVVCLTRLPGETYAEYILRVSRHALARIVKLHDLAHNLDDKRFGNPADYPASLRKRYLKAQRDILNAIAMNG